MLFFPSDRKETNQILVGKNMTRPSIALRFLTPKKLKYTILFNEDGERDIILRFLKVEVLLQIYQNQNNT